MARNSVGGAVADGLESGLRLGLDLVDRKDRKRRQEQSDALAMEDRAFQRSERDQQLRRQSDEDKRRTRNDRVTALSLQQADLAAEAKALGEAASPEDRQRIGLRLQTISRAKNEALTEAGGFDFDADERQAQSDLQALDGGQAVDLPPQRKVRALLSATRRDLADFRRGADGQPSRLMKAANDFRTGLANNDPAMLLAGANVILEQDLRKGIGEASPHGGKIVAKQVEAFDPSPDSTPDNPRFMPRLRVWVKDDRKLSAKEQAALKKWRAANPNAPEGATGYYFAPVTTDRSSRPDAPVKTIGVREGFEYLDKLLKIEEWANDPEVSKLLDDGIAQMGDERYRRTLEALGVPTGKTVKSELKMFTPGSEGRVVTTDDRGQVKIGDPIKGPEKTFAPPRSWGGGGGGSGGLKVRSTRVGANGNILLIMSDGSVKDTGQKDASLGRSVANMIARMSKESFEFRELPPEKQQQQALDMLGATISSEPAPSPAAPAGSAPDFSKLWKR
jgi:hypothetical protein